MSMISTENRDSISEYVNPFYTKKELVQFLNSTGKFWEYCNQATETISDKEVIKKALLYIEFEDMPLLFSLFGYEQCKSVFEEEIEPKQDYYGTISFLLKTLFFYER